MIIMRRKIIPRHCTMPVYHCSDGIDTVECWTFLNERFEECQNTNCEFYKKKVIAYEYNEIATSSEVVRGWS